ncbi:MAG: hypothetical protein HYS86_02995 [Candidatus Chisholmbacteria bacterium]|nr:hypothetical protein [Candidatus Chisholmbacteria bacterium]
MKAVQIKGYGGNEVVEVTENAPEPEISDEQVLVEVKAASINPADWKLRAGMMTGMKPLPFPVTLGGGFCGRGSGGSGSSGRG